MKETPRRAQSFPRASVSGSRRHCATSVGMPDDANPRLISVACKRAGISRSHFYEIKAAFEKYGADGLAPRERRRPRMPNETPPELVENILEMTARFPTYS